MARKRRMFRRIWAAALALALLPAGAWASETPEAAQPALGIYTTGDMAGRVGESDPLTGAEETGSYLKVASAMEEQRQRVDSVLLLDSGDAVANDLVSGGAADTALALRAIGYDALVPSLEEFRLGQGHRTAFFRDLTRADGQTTPVELISADWRDGESGQLEVQAWHIFTRQVDGRELRIAVVGLGTLAVPRSLPDYYYSDSSFGHPDNKDADPAWEWEHWIKPQLAGENCDLVVVCCHGDQAQLEAFAAATAGIDLLVGGHGQAGAGTFPNREGGQVSWVSGGGTALTCTPVTLAEDGTPVVGESRLLELADYENDAALAAATAAGQASLQTKAGQRAGALTGSWTELAASPLGQTDGADLVGRALLWTTGADGALITNGSLGALPERDAGAQGTGTLTLRDCALLARGESPVVVAELTGAQLKQWLETCAGRYGVNEIGQLTGGQDADFLYGMDYELYVGAPAGQRVVGLTCRGVPVEDETVYRVALEEAHLEDEDFPPCTVLWSADADMQYAATRGTMAALLAAYAARNGAISPLRESTWAVYPGAEDSPLTRLGFVELLYEAAGRPAVGANVAFVDVANSDGVVWAAEKRIVSGDGKGSFLPLSPVTREQAAAMLYNYARAAGLDLTAGSGAVNSLSDLSSVSGWAVPAVSYCLERGLLGPVDPPRLVEANLTRGDSRHQ